jgi:hypothetical protein
VLSPFAKHAEAGFQFSVLFWYATGGRGQVEELSALMNDLPSHPTRTTIRNASANAGIAAIPRTGRTITDFDEPFGGSGTVMMLHEGAITLGDRVWKASARALTVQTPGAVNGYYTSTDGEMLSLLPFNASTPVL